MPEVTQTLFNNDTTNVGSLQLFEEPAGKKYGMTLLVVSGGGAGVVPIAGDATYGLDVDVRRVLPDGVNMMPALDAASRAGYVRVCDGVNSMPTLDVVGRAGFVKLTDGVETQAISPELAGSICGDVAHDAVDAGNPVKIGLTARTAHPAAVANLDRASAYGDKLGRQVVLVDVPRELKVKGSQVINNSVAETTIIPGAAGTFHDLKRVTVTNLTGTGVRVDLRDATGAPSPVYRVWCPANQTVSFAVDLPQSVANNNWTATLSAAIAGDVYVFLEAVKDV